MRMASEKSTFEVVLASILGASAVLIVWGTLDAWQLAEFERVARVKVAGTTGRSDLTWYAADRAAAWSVGDQAPPTLEAINTICRGRSIVPTLGGRLSEFSGIQQLLLLSAAIGLLSLIAVLCGRQLAAWRTRDRLDQRLWSHPIIRNAISRSLVPSVRVGCLAAALAATVVWYAEFDRNADFTFESRNATIQPHQLLQLLIVVGMCSLAIGARNWRVAVSNAMKPGRNPRAVVCCRCGYSLEGLSTKTCPECGEVQSAKPFRVRHVWRSPVVWVSLALLASLVTAGVWNAGRSLGALSGVKFATPSAAAVWRWITVRSHTDHRGNSGVR